MRVRVRARARVFVRSKPSCTLPANGCHLIVEPFACSSASSVFVRTAEESKVQNTRNELSVRFFLVPEAPTMCVWVAIIS